MVVSEVCADPPGSGSEFCEIQALSATDITTGWHIYTWDGTTFGQHAITGKQLDAGEAYLFADATSSPFGPVEYLGYNIGSWFGAGAVMLTDDSGEIVDFVAFGAFNVAGITTPMPVGEEWVGPTAPRGGSNDVVTRLIADTNTAADWAAVPEAQHSLGQANPGLTGGGGSGGDEPEFLSITATDFVINDMGGDEFHAFVNLFDSLEIFVAVDDPNPWNTISFTAEDTGEVGVALTPGEMGINQPFVLVPGTPPAPDRFIYTNPVQSGPVHLTTFTGAAQALGTIEITFEATDGNGNYISAVLTLETLSGPKILPPRAPVAEITGNVIDGFEAILEVGDPIDIVFTVVDPNATDEVTIELTNDGGTLGDTQAGLTVTLPRTIGPSPTPVNVFLPGPEAFVPGELIIGISADDGNGNVTATDADDHRPLDAALAGSGPNKVAHLRPRAGVSRDRLGRFRSRSHVHRDR